MPFIRATSGIRSPGRAISAAAFRAGAFSGRISSYIAPKEGCRSRCATCVLTDMRPLSIGQLKGDMVECGYHGMTFGADGMCRRIPGQSTIPGSARVTSYPVHDRMGLIWIWMGDQALANPEAIFALPAYGARGWRATEGDALSIGTNYLNLADNLCDPSHVSFVHKTTLGNAASENIPVEYKETGEGVLVWRWILDAPPIPLFAKYGHFSGNVDRWHYYDYKAPCIAIIDFGTADAGAIVNTDDRSQGMRIFACHFLTPVDEHRCIDHWLFVRNFALDDAEMDTALIGDFRTAFDEDKQILEQIEAVERSSPGIKRIRLAIDAAPQRMRRAVERMSAEVAPEPMVSSAS